MSKEKPSFLQNVKGMFRDRETSLRDKMMIVIGAAYIVSPIDIVPDLMPLLGYGDDLAVLLGTITLLRRTYKNYVQRSRVVATQELDDYNK